MKSMRTADNFTIVVHHPHQDEHPSLPRLIEESSVAGSAYPTPHGVRSSGALWIGSDHLLSRNEVAELISRMQYWLDYGSLAIDEEHAPKNSRPEV